MTELDIYNKLRDDWKNPEVNYINAQTSGSTGEPKIIRLDKEIIKKSAQRTIEFFGLDKDWILISCLSGRYIGGKMMAIRADECGADFINIQPSNRPNIRGFVEMGKKALIAIVPSQMVHLLTQSFPSNLINNLHFLIGGSPIPDELRRQIAQSQLNCWETYGMTETASHIALRKVEYPESDFILLPGINIDLSDNNTLVISNIYGRPLITNDLAIITSPGKFKIIGRADNVIITGGLKVIPEKLENTIKRLIFTNNIDGITDLMVSSRPHQKWGAALELTIETDRNDSTKLIEEIYHLLRLSPEIVSHEMPKKISITHSLPRTPNGKLCRK